MGGLRDVAGDDVERRELLSVAGLPVSAARAGGIAGPHERSRVEVDTDASSGVSGEHKHS